MKKQSGKPRAVNPGKARLLAGPAVDMEFPFDPAQIRFSMRTLTVGQLLERLKRGEVDLEPEFQRRGGIWKPEGQSRLIESLLIRLPLATLIFDATDMDRWIVIDGLQRLTVMKEFVLDKAFTLKGLEFLGASEGLSFDQLPRALQRRIMETPLSVMLLEYPTPPNVKYVLFERFNTGGSPLKPQEARHAINPGPVVGFLRELAESEEFLEAAGRVSRQRMADRECVLRVVAFMMTPYSAYKRDTLHFFLNATMVELNQCSAQQRAKLGKEFRAAMVTATQIFGQNAFRKVEPGATRRAPLNKQLLEVWGATLALASPNERQQLVLEKRQVLKRSADLLANPEFKLSISESSSKPAMVKIRFSRVEALVREVLGRA